MLAGVSDLELVHDMGELAHNPLRWVGYAFPWGKDSLTGYQGPDTW